MKKSELYSQIQTEIKSILSEESAEDIENKTAAQAELNKELEKTQDLLKENQDEVDTTVHRFIKAMAKRYDYDERGVVHAIMSALRQIQSTLPENQQYEGLNEEEEMGDDEMDKKASKDFDPNDLDGDDIDDDRLRQRVQRLRHTGSNFDDLNESLNPEVTKALDRFITAMARKYGYEEQDAVYAIMAVLKQRNYDGLNEEEGMDDDEMDKKASKGAKKGDSVTTIANKLGETASEMKRVVNKWKKMEDGSEKEKLKGRLKSLSKIKKELEGLL
tara:strand:- start:1198 stop:2019 length:822 start_codon:yes stop_codon:yes gene_type:complete